LRAVALRRTNGSEYLLTGLLVCEKCGKRFLGPPRMGTRTSTRGTYASRGTGTGRKGATRTARGDGHHAPLRQSELREDSWDLLAGISTSALAPICAGTSVVGSPGHILVPGEDGYDLARVVRNAMVDRRPPSSLAARCVSELKTG
jgi:hypothetical protein